MSYPHDDTYLVTGNDDALEDFDDSYITKGDDDTDYGFDDVYLEGDDYDYDARVDEDSYALTDEWGFLAGFML